MRKIIPVAQAQMLFKRKGLHNNLFFTKLKLVPKKKFSWKEICYFLLIRNLNPQTCFICYDLVYNYNYRLWNKFGKPPLDDITQTSWQ